MGRGGRKAGMAQLYRSLLGQFLDLMEVCGEG